VGTIPGEPVEVEIDPDAPTTTLAEGEEPAPPETTPGVPIFASVDVGTTIAPDNLDPSAPLPSIATTENVGACR
jgi:hypothetical protein